MTPDPHPQIPDHPQTPDGQRVYDPSCWMCREITAQPVPGWLESALERVAGPLGGYLAEVVVSDYLPCATCDHPAEAHKLIPSDEYPTVLCDVSCTAFAAPDVPCPCSDYDGYDHPERPSLAEAWVYLTDDGGVGVV